ncbi:MAG: hypothetical protein PVG78_07305 [Desulfobacterales bacterium]
METSKIILPPMRVTDLIRKKESGCEVSCDPSFEVVPVDFAHRDHRYQAHIFLCRYQGRIDETPYLFRKCYARGCPQNLCPHVAQAVMIANRYLQRDFNRLKKAGIEVPDKMFTLDEMVVGFEKTAEADGPLLTLPDYINIAKEGNAVSAKVTLEYLPAVEHFANEKNKQTFLNGDFAFTMLGRSGSCQRCFGCYATESEAEGKPAAVAVANKRLALLYEDFDNAGIQCEKRFF